jgi:hypothetical protein
MPLTPPTSGPPWRKSSRVGGPRAPTAGRSHALPVADHSKPRPMPSNPQATAALAALAGHGRRHPQHRLPSPQHTTRAPPRGPRIRPGPRQIWGASRRRHIRRRAELQASGPATPTPERRRRGEREPAAAFTAAARLTGGPLGQRRDRGSGGRAGGG